MSMDLFHLPDAQSVLQTKYIGNGPQTTGWTAWRKPRGISMVHFLLIGPGGGGGGGAGNTAGAVKGGGGGGSAGNVTVGLFPAWILPDILWVNVSSGGLGGVGGTSGAGSNGGFTGNANIGLIQNGLAILEAFGGGPGSGGTQAAGGAAGTNSNGAITAASLTWANWGIWQATAGPNGTAGGGGNTAGSNFTFAFTVGLFPGTGGGGSTSADAAGGNITASAPVFAQINGGPAGSNAGSNGFRHGQYPIFYGGTGGGASNSTVGGQGGSAASSPGAGGGGGGGGVTTGGRGGDGGPGLVIISCF